MRFRSCQPINGPEDLRSLYLRSRIFYEDLNLPLGDFQWHALLSVCELSPTQSRSMRIHRKVWPELLAKLKEVGISDYSIFRRGQDLVLVMRVNDFDNAWQALDQDPVNLRWQQEMARLFEPVADLQPGERFAMMKEVFYME